jgi:RNase P/RNase MRP subunit POP5
VFLKGEKRPFFRHYRGQERSHCLVAASRVALQRALLAAEGIFELPGRRLEVRVVGLSGTSYSGIAEATPERAFVRELLFTDEVFASVEPW